ncbi:ATP-grasp domain-containing protein [Synechococcus sp. UW140]|uniref:ATP-grasp domain-containing protein n=1 Tax=Synechococcus sp. UW140 TaxID=368503 RepID=UPI000E0EA354|nr:ATP-grasp domain-containing protein [Synechococcus sp. UW140]
MINILISSIGRRGYLADFFHDLSPDIFVVGTDMDPYCIGFSSCDKYILAPPIDDDGYILHLSNVLDANDIHFYFSANDFDVLTISSSIAEISKHSNALFIGPSHDFALKVLDKSLFASFARPLGIATPPTVLLSDASALPFDKAVVKPRLGSGSANTYIVSSESEYSGLLEYLSNCFSLDDFIVQEFVDGVEYNIDILYGGCSRVLSFCVKEKLYMRAGETDKARLCDPSKFCDLIDSLRGLPHLGNLDVDLIRSADGSFFLIDVNPRFGGGYFFSHYFGANFPYLLLKNLGIASDLTPSSRFSNSAILAKSFSVCSVG